MEDRLRYKLVRDPEWELARPIPDSKLPEGLTEFSISHLRDPRYDEIRIIYVESPELDTDWRLNEGHHFVYGRLTEPKKDPIDYMLDCYLPGDDNSEKSQQIAR